MSHGDTSAELVEFLTARLDEDEATARAAAEATDAEWECVEGEHSYAWMVRGATLAGSPGYQYHAPVTMDREGLSDSVIPEAGAHIARHDPARVLAEVNAKRAIVALHSANDTWGSGRRLHCSMCGDIDAGPVDYPCDTLRLLASVWVDAPGFREEWR